VFENTVPEYPIYILLTEDADSPLTPVTLQIVNTSEELPFSLSQDGMLYLTKLWIMRWCNKLMID